ncbi:MAG: mandelate racemase/muconate lactonizing enzyme family protein [Myxococcales bacterium]|nr:MAG: mandelate racemase/muconate lactonizing enzyme family protein [Myxococcales bacterium]
MTDLHAQIDVIEGELSESLVGGAAGLSRRTFAVLRLMRSDGTTGLGEASPLPGYSPDSISDVSEELQRLADEPVRANPLVGPRELLAQTFAAHPLKHPSSRFALETAMLDWLGHSRGKPVHQILAGDVAAQPIPIADLVVQAPAAWPARVDALLTDGATHLKLKVGSDLDAEVAALREIRRAHPTVPLRLDANRRISIEALRRHAGSLETLELELIEEPVAPEDWPAALSLPLPFALDETLRDADLSRRVLESGKVCAVVIKPTVLGGLRASFEVAERAAAHGAEYLVSHTFDGPIARAVTAELALALQTKLAAGLGWHPALELWPAHHTAAIRDRQIAPHDAPGLGLHFEEVGGG